MARIAVGGPGVVVPGAPTVIERNLPVCDLWVFEQRPAVGGHTATVRRDGSSPTTAPTT